MRLISAIVGGFVLLSVGTSDCVGQIINPADYGNITLHLKADSLGLANQQAVATWGPLSAAGTTQPTFIASDARFNNQPVVSFDGVDDVMIWSMADLDAHTIFAVVTLESNARALATLISNGGDALDIRRHNSTLFYRSPGQGMDANDFVGGSPAGTLSINGVASGSYSAGVAHIVVAAAGGPKNYSTFWLGNARSTLTRWWTGSVAEVLIYDGVLTAEGVDRVGYYLQTKFNLPSVFPPPDADRAQLHAPPPPASRRKPACSPSRERVSRSRGRWKTRLRFRSTTVRWRARRMPRDRWRCCPNDHDVHAHRHQRPRIANEDGHRSCRSDAAAAAAQ